MLFLNILILSIMSLFAGSMPVMAEIAKMTDIAEINSNNINTELSQPLPSSTLVTGCRQQLTQNKQKLHQLNQCQQLVNLGSEGNTQPWFIYGQLLIDTPHLHRQSYREKRGLFYWILAAEQQHKRAIQGISHYVQHRMVDNKIPLKYSHLLPYLAADWQLANQDPQHHYARYQAWFAQVKVSQRHPEQLSNTQLIDIATAVENGYFLGKNISLALRLYELAAQRGDGFAMYKSGHLLYDKDLKTALSYLYRAAALQSNQAMLKLGDHFACNQQPQQAEHWYQQAMQANNEYAAEELHLLKTTGLPSQC